MPASDVFKLREPIQFLSQQHLIPTIRRNATTTHKLHRIHRPHPPTDRRPPKKTLKHVTRQRKRLEHAHREFRLPFPRLNPVVAQIPLLTTRPPAPPSTEPSLATRLSRTQGETRSAPGARAGRAGESAPHPRALLHRPGQQRREAEAGGQAAAQRARECQGVWGGGLEQQRAFAAVTKLL